MYRYFFERTPHGTYALREEFRQSSGTWCISAYYELRENSTRERLREYARDYLGHDGEIFDA